MPKPPTNLNNYRGILPYSSEIFGIYQPLLGWKSARIGARVEQAALVRSAALLNNVGDRVAPVVEAKFTPAERKVEVTKLDAGSVNAGTALSGIVTAAVRGTLPPKAEYTPAIWAQVLSPDRLRATLDGPVKQRAVALYTELTTPSGPHIMDTGSAEKATRALLNRESQVTGLLTQLRDRELHDQLKHMFYDSLASPVDPLWSGLTGADPFETLDPTSQLDRVGLSPVGLAHLFRQYFSEFDTFLGQPVGHVWVAPGSTVELIEVHTRRLLQEETLERSTESTVRVEKAVALQDELSDAVKEDNRSGTKFGANVAANQHWGWGSADESASFSLENTQQRAREQIHTTKRDQSEKLTTEIKQNFKSTFRTVTETTDTSTKRYVLTNTSDDLVNYELRRKMRQVGVQVQDIGSYLCWQTYVDDPAEEIGLAKMVHVGAPPDLSKVVQPEMIVPPQPFSSDSDLTIPFLSNDGAAKDDTFEHGSETSLGLFDGTNHIVADFPQGPYRCPQPGFKLTAVSLDPQGADAKLSVREIAESPSGSGDWKFTVHLDHVNFNDRDSLPVKAKLGWTPVFDQKVIDAENAKRIALFTERERDAAQQAFVGAARDRIKLASRITKRKFEDLREEERIVVYRKLVQEMLTPKTLVPQPDKHTQHVVAELIDSIFDVDKMLYFVAPEWWRPRLHRAHQQLGSTQPVSDPNGQKIEYHNGIPRESIGAWGEADSREDSYYITEESEPARLGSSLGWLLQLDGDDQRNAFLNAPWVKAVMPIRPGKEKAALNWLKHVEGTGTIGENDLYLGPEPEWRGKTVFEVLAILAARVAAKHREGITTKGFTDPLDDRSTVRATPVDRVYEHGFNPLPNGFRSNTTENFELFDQWVEILPTDQVVAVPVRYDPKTGRQI
ncbi:hypothetical protein ACIQUM_36025 [Amycolatopsis azurea]|uniref:hypothetical protein n=1 Tax=Amycolatopsis azurea TaxID=36819 RepID=UPI003810A716